MRNVAMVTGAGRGIGLELCRLLLERDYVVLACPRRSGSPDLAELATEHAEQLYELPMDVADVASVARAADRASGLTDGIDLLFNNAGIYPRDEGGLERIAPESLHEAFDVNAVGCLRVVQAFLPLLRGGRGKRLMQVTSLMGSIDDNSSGGSYAYRMSKAALNMLTRNLAHALGPEGFVTLSIHPGWVETRMGGPGAPMGLRVATEEVLRTALSAGPADSGGFKGPGGGDLPY